LTHLKAKLSRKFFARKENEFDHGGHRQLHHPNCTRLYLSRRDPAGDHKRVRLRAYVVRRFQRQLDHSRLHRPRDRRHGGNHNQVDNRVRAEMQASTTDVLNATLPRSRASATSFGRFPAQSDGSGRRVPCLQVSYPTKHASNAARSRDVTIDAAQATDFTVIR
jgi:hypothetical protein